MQRTDKEEFVIGAMSLLANRLGRFGDEFLSDITFKQWYLLMMISRMQDIEKSVREIADFTGTSRQNVKKMLETLEAKGYVSLEPSKRDARALAVKLTRKSKRLLADDTTALSKETSVLFSPLSDVELNTLVVSLQKLVNCLDEYEYRD